MSIFTDVALIRHDVDAMLPIIKDSNQVLHALRAEAQVSGIMLTRISADIHQSLAVLQAIAADVHAIKESMTPPEVVGIKVKPGTVEPQK